MQIDLTKTTLPLYIYRSKFHSSGGAERFIQNLVDYLPSEKIRTTIVSNSWPSSDRYELSILPRSSFGRFARAHRFVQAASRVMAENPAAIHQSHERIPGCDIFRLGDGLHRIWLRNLATQGYLYRFKRLDPYHRYILELERRIFESPHTHVVASSKQVFDDIFHEYKIDASRVSLIENGVDLSRFRSPSLSERLCERSRLGIGEDQLCVVFVGSDFQRKGLSRILKAAESNSKLAVLVVGAGKLLDICAGRKSMLSSDQIKFLGNRRDIHRIMWAADFFALPSRYDPSPNALIEAAACGLPVICSEEVGFQKEIVGSFGVVVGDSEESMTAAISMLSCPETRRIYGSRAKEWANKHSYERIVKQWVSLYERLIHQKRSRRRT